MEGAALRGGDEMVGGEEGVVGWFGSEGGGRGGGHGSGSGQDGERRRSQRFVQGCGELCYQFIRREPAPACTKTGTVNTT